MSGHTRWEDMKARRDARLVLRSLERRAAWWREQVGDEDFEHAVRYWHQAAGDLSPTVVLTPDLDALCWVCGQPALYVDYDFDAAVCGGICVWAGWQAMRLHDTPWRAW